MDVVQQPRVEREPVRQRRLVRVPQQRHHAARLGHAVDDRAANRERAFQIEIEIVRAQQRAVVQHERNLHEPQPLARRRIPHAERIRRARAKADVAIRAERGIHEQPGLCQKRRRPRAIEMQIVLAARDDGFADGLFHVLLLLREHLVAHGRQVAAVQPDVPPAPPQVARDFAHRAGLVAVGRPVVPAVHVVDDVALADARGEKEKRRAKAEPLLGLDPRREHVELPRAFPQTHHAAEVPELFSHIARVADMQRDGARQLVAAVELHAVHIVAQARGETLSLRPRNRVAPLRKFRVQHFIRHRPVERGIPAPRAVLRLEIADTVARRRHFLRAAEERKHAGGWWRDGIAGAVVHFARTV